MKRKLLLSMCVLFGLNSAAHFFFLFTTNNVKFLFFAVLSFILAIICACLWDEQRPPPSSALPHIQRALDLFLTQLSHSQRRTWKRYGYIDVIGSDGHEYRIRTSNKMAYNVRDRTAGASWCAYPVGVPAPDMWLAQMLLLQTDAAAFKRVAFTK